MAKQKISTVLRTIKRHSQSALMVRLLSLLIICLGLVTAQAQQTAFTYQGKLTDGGSAANGNYDLQFALFDSPTDGTQISTTKTLASVSVSAGIFTVSLDFGANAFSGATRYLEISARSTGVGSYMRMTPRQPISSIPYAVRSLSAATADVATNAQQLAGVAANQYVQGSDTRLSDARTPTAGSSNYIQNSTSPQTAANFNISGNGTAGGTLSANLVNANTQYNLNGNRAFAITGGALWPNSNTFGGAGAGASTTPGSSNDNGSNNSFFGVAAGTANSTGFQNAFFGSSAGVANTTGSGNAFFGNQAGYMNTTGGLNSFFGNWSGLSTTTGNLNSFFGHRAGSRNTTGSSNVILGYDAGQNNTAGSSNSFLGTAAGGSNTTGNSNTYLGTRADGTADINNATAVGANAKVTQSNSLVLGGIAGINGASANTNVGIGTTNPTTAMTGGTVLHVLGPSTALALEASNQGGQKWEWQSTVLAGNGAMSLFNASNTTHLFTVLANGNVGIGAPLPTARLRVGGAIGTMASFGSVGDFAIDDSTVSGGRFIVKDNGNVGIGTNAPSTRLDVDGGIRFSALASGGNVQLCWNNLNGRLASCSSSLRYKTDLRSFNRGLNLINRLQPITFKWKSDQTSDLGLGAEDVAKVEPLLVTHNADGEIEGVKYDRVAVVLINAVKEQQAQIERQQAEINSLRKLVCSSRRHARICK